MNRLTHLMLVLALVLQGGFHWGLLQSSAWLVMYSGYSAEMSFSEAINMTLDAENKCNICEFIEDSKNLESEKQIIAKFQKFDLMFESFEQILTPVVVFPLVQHSPLHSDRLGPLPEIPPPILG